MGERRPMTAAQTAMYFSLWGRVRDAYKAKGLACGDAQRHALHNKALGVSKSSKDFTNADVDKIKATFLAIVEPGNLDAQLHQLEQPEKRKSFLLAQVRDLAGRCVDKPGREGAYLDGMTRKIFGPAQYQLLDEIQLGQLCGVLHRRIAQIQCQNQPKQAVGALSKAAQQAEESNCPW